MRCPSGSRGDAPGSPVGDVIAVPTSVRSRPELARRLIATSGEFARHLRAETVGGVVLLLAAAIALQWANSPFSDGLALGAAAAGSLLHRWLRRRRVRAWWIYVPLGVAVWIAVHDAGVHATITGVLLGLLTRVRPDDDERFAPALRLEHRLQPRSAGVCVPCPRCSPRACWAGGTWWPCRSSAAAAGSP